MCVCVCVGGMCVHMCARVWASACVYVCMRVCVVVCVRVCGGSLAHNLPANKRIEPTPPNNTILLLHRAPQLIADPAPIPCLCITSHNRTYNIVRESKLPTLAGMVPLRRLL